MSAAKPLKMTPEQEQGLREAVAAGLCGPAEIRRGPEGFQFWSHGRMWFDGAGSGELRHLMPWLNGSQNVLAELDATRSALSALQSDYEAAVRALRTSTGEPKHGGCAECGGDDFPCIDPLCPVGAVLTTPRAQRGAKMSAPLEMPDGVVFTLDDALARCGLIAVQDATGTLTERLDAGALVTVVNALAAEREKVRAMSAILEADLAWHDDPNEAFERRAAEFRFAPENTLGYLAPGKDDPCGPVGVHAEEQHYKNWQAFCDRKRSERAEAIRAALAATAEKGESNG